LVEKKEGEEEIAKPTSEPTPCKFNNSSIC
jgi:hypothetical protein